MHCASVLAIIVYTRREIRDMVTLANDAARSMWLYVAIGIIPAGIIGLFFRAAIENAFSSPLIIGVGFIFTGNILILCYSFQKSDQELTKKRALLVGLAQILALFPGVSRSGTTISFGIFAGLKRDVAFRFSFLMAIPLIIAATAINFNYACLLYTSDAADE